MSGKTDTKKDEKHDADGLDLSVEAGLRDRAAVVPGDIAERLHGMRRAAVAEIPEQDHQWLRGRWNGWLAAGTGMALAVLLAVVIVFDTGGSLTEIPLASGPDIAIVEDLEVLEDLEFLAWLEEEDSGAG